MYIVGFNGPPRSGKDTMARMLAEHMDSQGVTLPVIEVSLSLPLRRVAYAMTGWAGDCDGENYERFKEQYFDEFLKDGRHIMIDVSESFLKPTYGQTIMAKMLMRQLIGFDGLVLIRDTGFKVEAKTMATWVGKENFYVAQVHRNGCSFDNDSREWVEHSQMDVWENVYGLEELKDSVQYLHQRLLQLGWKL